MVSLSPLTKSYSDLIHDHKLSDSKPGIAIDLMLRLRMRCICSHGSKGFMQTCRVIRPACAPKCFSQINCDVCKLHSVTRPFLGDRSKQHQRFTFREILTTRRYALCRWVVRRIIRWNYSFIKRRLLASTVKLYSKILIFARGAVCCRTREVWGEEGNVRRKTNLVYIVFLSVMRW